MSNVQSYNALIDRFKAFASGHFILKTFSHGQIDTADLEKFTEYPFMHVVPSNVTYAKGTKTFSFQIVLADLPRDKDSKVEFQREVLSDLQRIAEDLIAEITNHRMLFGDLITVQNVTLEPFLEEFHNTLTGWTVSLELLVPYYWDACSIPAEWNDFFESGSGGTGSILTFIDSIVRDENGNVSLVNDEATPLPNYYYGTDDEGVRGWYLTTDNIGLTCETIGDCQTIIDIEAAIDALEEEILLKADITSISAVGFSNDYNDLDNLPTIPTGTVTSVGLTMPSAFSVANSPITTSGDIAVTGAGTVSQYVRGDGSLANFPSSTGGGSSLAFYLNGSVAQGTIGGVAFKEMDRTPVFGAGTDFTINANGYIQSFITDANVPNQLEIPAGNWNFETYFSASSSGGTPSFYVELYKWNGATLSLIASNSATPEGITNGTAIDAYFSALAVPQTTLAATDRLAIRIYVTHSGRTIKLHTENSHLCQVITTFSTGLTALNGLTAQVQNFATGTSGTDFAISSATSTHTFNLPTASAANRGALSSADWSTFNGKFTLPALTSGSVLFSNGTTIAQDNANLFFDDTNNRLGVGTATPATTLQIAGTTTTQNILVQTGATYDIGVSATRFRDAWFSRNVQCGSVWTANIAIAATNLTFYNNSVAVLGTLFGTGNLLLSTGTQTDAGYKLDVNGTARANSIFFGAGLPSVLSVDPTTALTNITTAGTSVRIGDNVGSTITGYQAYVTSPGIADRQYTSGEGGVMMLGSTLGFNRTFSPTSGTGIFNILRLSSTINQTGGANGITRGLYINPTLTAAANFRAIETTAGRVVISDTATVTGTNATSLLDLSQTWNTTGAPIALKVNITDTASASLSDLISLQVGGSVRFRVLKSGFFTFNTGGEIAGNLVIGGSTIDASSQVEVRSVTKGFLPPRMTTTQKNAIASPAAGLVVYDTTLNKLCVRTAAAWETITSL